MRRKSLETNETYQDEEKKKARRHLTTSNPRGVEHGMVAQQIRELISQKDELIQ